MGDQVPHYYPQALLHAVRGPFRSYNQVRQTELSRHLGSPFLSSGEDFMHSFLVKVIHKVKGRARNATQICQSPSLSHPVLAFSMPLNNRNAVPLTNVIKANIKDGRKGEKKGREENTKSEGAGGWGEGAQRPCSSSNYQ